MVQVRIVTLYFLIFKIVLDCIMCKMNNNPSVEAQIINNFEYHDYVDDSFLLF